MSWSGLTKVLSGLFLAIALIVGGGYAAAQYLITQFTALPPRPTFPNDKSARPKPAVNPKPAPQPTVSPMSKLAEPAKLAVAETYRARVTLTEGLNLRDTPSREAKRVGGLDYNARLVILEESSDRQWLKVRLETGTLEGWIRSGYTERLN